MRISRTEFDKFDTLYYKQAYPGGCWHGQRYGQAWYNHFKLHAHNASVVDRIILDKIYNDPSPANARTSILQNFTDDTQ
jgi:hypothetical protein